ncbi:MAG: glycosyltransferase family 2 protein [Kiritimatiellae bacterium]|nr:glycosyltransferase family 2 protein [Kiritimatiellia bacterium]
MQEPSTTPAPRKTITVVMPALNEEGNIQGAMDAVASAVEGLFEDYELIVINDGSTDRTPAIVEENRARNPKIRMISHPSPQGFGASYNSGRLAASMTYCVMVQGDSPFTKEELRAFLAHTGEADVVCGYIANPAFRSQQRQDISRRYTTLMNFLFRMNMKYFNGPQIHRTDWLKQLVLRNSGYGFQAEVLIKAIKGGKSYVEIPIRYTERPGGGESKVFKLKNIVSVAKTLVTLWLWNLFRRRP